MKKLLQIVSLVIALSPAFVKAEGSKELTPNTNTLAATNAGNTSVGYLQHDDNGTQTISYGFLKPSTWSYGTETFSSDYRLYIRLEANEKLYYGVRRIATNETNAVQGKLILTLKAGSGAGTAVQTTTLANDGGSTNGSTLKTGNTNNPVSGVIWNAAQAAIGPKLGTTATSSGYNPLIYTNNTGLEQDFWIEFTQEGEATMSAADKKSWYDLWDFTVVSGTSTVMPGRLFSKQWSFTAGGSANLLSSTFALYPLIPSETDATKYYVKKFTMAGMRPFGFRFVSNKFGSSASFGTTFEERRQSQLQRSGYTEYANFINNPDPAVWPSASAPTFNIQSTSGCVNNEGQMTFTSTSNVPTIFTVVVDLNGTVGYQAGTKDVLLEKSFGAGTNTLVWNGKDGLGATVPSGTQIKYYYTSGAAPVNYPIFDAEGNKSGFKSENIRPLASSTTDLLYWDDSKLPTAKFPAPQKNLTGTNASTGTHLWGATNDDGDGYTVNTWTYGYTNFSEETKTFTYNCITVPAPGSQEPTTLPVSLTTFTATAGKNGVALNWATASEKNNDYFQVERSQDGVTFTTIGRVKGNGTSLVVNTYNFTDKAAANGTVYYRLKQVDFSTAFEYSAIRPVSVKNAAAIQVTVYPNPTSATVNVNLPTGNYTLKVAALTGNILKQKSVTTGDAATLDVQDLAMGSYILIVEGPGVKQTSKFLKN